MTALKAFSITNELSQFIPNAKKKNNFFSSWLKMAESPSGFAIRPDLLLYLHEECAQFQGNVVREFINKLFSKRSLLNRVSVNYWCRHTECHTQKRRVSTSSETNRE